MDVLYEECAVNKNSARGEKIYKILNVAYYFFLILAIIGLVTVLSNIGGVLTELDPSAKEEEKQAVAFLQTFFFLGVFVLITCGSLSLALFFLKRRINISYDYTFVSGELRIVKVFNINRRKLVTKISNENILQLGDVDSSSYTRLSSDPTNKQVVCTPNVEPKQGKFFLYIHVSDPTGKKLYVLECREELLVNILHFVKRGTLADDYVMQEKKK